LPPVFLHLLLSPPPSRALQRGESIRADELTKTIDLQRVPVDRESRRGLLNRPVSRALGAAHATRGEARAAHSDGTAVRTRVGWPYPHAPAPRSVSLGNLNSPAESPPTKIRWPLSFPPSSPSSSSTLGRRKRPFKLSRRFLALSPLWPRRMSPP